MSNISNSNIKDNGMPAVTGSEVPNHVAIEMMEKISIKGGVSSKIIARNFSSAN